MKRLLAATLTSTLMACAAPSETPHPMTPEQTTNSVTPASAANAVDANTLTALDLYDRLRKTEDGNIFISPLSLSTAFGLVLGGARNDTRGGITKAMHYPNTDVHSQLKALLDDINIDQEHRRVATNNGVWIDNSAIVKPAFETILTGHYQAQVNRVDFTHRPDESRLAINDWVEDKTEDRIQDLLGPGIISALTRLVLVNTVYMKANWAATFEESETQERDFTTASGKKVKTPMMRQISHFQRAKFKGGEALSMPYYGHELSMVVLLPKTENGLSKLEDNLTYGRLTRIVSDLKTSPRIRSDLRFPKLKINASYNLSKALIDMGMGDAFSDVKADFSGINGRKDMSLSAVVQQTFLEVNEKGTEAAAATAAVIAVTSAGPPPKPPVKFYADHPFLFFIKDNSTDAIIFMGRITEPGI